MSAIGVLRSFAEAQEYPETPIRDGVTYGHAREVVREITRLRAEIERARKALHRIANEPMSRASCSQVARNALARTQEGP